MNKINSELKLFIKKWKQAATCLEKGEKAFFAADYKHAKPLLEKAIEKYTVLMNKISSEYLHIERGCAYYYLRDYANAIKDCLLAINIDPRNGDSYYNHALALGGLGRSREVFSSLRKAIKLNPKDYLSLNNIGWQYYLAGSYQNAISYYKKALKLNPKDCLMYDNIGIAYIAQGKYNQSLEYFNKALTLNPKYYDSLNNRGVSYFYLGKKQKALNDLNKAVKISKYKYPAYYNKWVITNCKNLKDYADKLMQLEMDKYCGVIDKGRGNNKYKDMYIASYGEVAE